MEAIPNNHRLDVFILMQPHPKNRMRGNLKLEIGKTKKGENLEIIHLSFHVKFQYLFLWEYHISMSQNQGGEKIDFKVNKQAILLVPIFVETRSFGSSPCYPTDDALQLCTDGQNILHHVGWFKSTATCRKSFEEARYTLL